MNSDIQAKMNNVCFVMTETEKEFRLDPSSDAQFCARILSGATAQMNMALSNQWGKKMLPVAVEAEVEEPAPKPSKKSK